MKRNKKSKKSTKSKRQGVPSINITIVGDKNEIHRDGTTMNGDDEATRKKTEGGYLSHPFIVMLISAFLVPLVAMVFFSGFG